LNTPVEHARDIRSELMVKLALLDRGGADPQLLPPSPPLGERAKAKPQALLA
jgi:hypothetical protein